MYIIGAAQMLAPLEQHQSTLENLATVPSLIETEMGSRVSPISAGKGLS